MKMIQQSDTQVVHEQFSDNNTTCYTLQLNCELLRGRALKRRYHRAENKTTAAIGRIHQLKEDETKKGFDIFSLLEKECTNLNFNRSGMTNEGSFVTWDSGFSFYSYRQHPIRHEELLFGC